MSASRLCPRVKAWVQHRTVVLPTQDTLTFLRTTISEGEVLTSRVLRDWLEVPGECLHKGRCPFPWATQAWCHMPFLPSYALCQWGRSPGPAAHWCSAGLPLPPYRSTQEAGGLGVHPAELCVHFLIFSWWHAAETRTAALGRDHQRSWYISKVLLKPQWFVEVKLVIFENKHSTEIAENILTNLGGVGTPGILSLCDWNGV